MEPKLSKTGIKYREKYADYVKLLKGRLTEKRFYHSLAVAKEALRLSEKYGCDTEKAYLAGLLHDICKDLDKKEQLQLFAQFGIILDDTQKSAPKLWHSVLGAEYVKTVLNINDEDIILAIKYHTTAAANMCLLAKIIFLADFTSEERDYPGVEDMRRAVDKDLDVAMMEALSFSIEDLTSRGLAVHKDTLEAFAEISIKKGE